MIMFHSQDTCNTSGKFDDVVLNNYAPFSARCAWGNSGDDDNYGGSDNYDSSSNYGSRDVMIMPSSDMCVCCV